MSASRSLSFRTRFSSSKRRARTSSSFPAQSASMYSRAASSTARHLSRDPSLFQRAQNTSSSESLRSSLHARERALPISSSSAGE